MITVSVASLIAIGSWHAYTNSQVPKHAQAFDVDAFEKARRISGPEKLNPQLKEDEVNTLKRWMITWYQKVAEFAPSDDMYFADFDAVLNELATHHRRIKYEDWETLFHDAKNR